MQTRSNWTLAAALVVATPALLLGVGVPNTFVDGEVADAGAVNANFKDLSDRLEDLGTWQTYTPVLAGDASNPSKAVGGLLQEVGYYRVIGKTLEIQYNYVSDATASGSATGSGSYTWSIPPGYTIDTSQFGAVPCNDRCSKVGTAIIGNATTAISAYMQLKNTTSMYMVPVDNTASGRVGSNKHPIDVGSRNYWFHVVVPIL